MQKINNQSFTVFYPLKNNNNELVSFTDENLKALHYHYKFQASDPSGHSLSKNF